MADEWAQIISFCFAPKDPEPAHPANQHNQPTRVTPDETVEYTQVDAFVLFEFICDSFHINNADMGFISF